MSTLAMPPVVDLATWKERLAEQQAQEEAASKALQAAVAARRRLPMTKVQGDYTFVGPEGDTSFAEIFAGNHQLVVYHYMFAPDWEKACPSCTRYMLEVGTQFQDYLSERDTRFVAISRAPYDKLQSFAAESGMQLPWYSAPREFSEEMGAINDDFGDLPGFTTFFRDDEDNVYRTFHPGESGEVDIHGDQLLRMVPYGMQLIDEDSPEGWPQSFTLY